MNLPHEVAPADADGPIVPPVLFGRAFVARVYTAANTPGRFWRREFPDWYQVASLAVHQQYLSAAEMADGYRVLVVTTDVIEKMHATNGFRPDPTIPPTPGSGELVVELNPQPDGISFCPTGFWWAWSHIGDRKSESFPVVPKNFCVLLRSGMFKGTPKQPV